MIKFFRQPKHSPDNNTMRELFLVSRDLKRLIRNKKKLDYRAKLVEEMHFTDKKRCETILENCG